jgi:calcium-dependent protein kinase
MGTGNGELEYSEWVIATADKRKLLTEERLNVAFKMFDKDGGGSISSDEIKQTLGVGKNIDERVWAEVIKESDPDGNGVISFAEFKTMMLKFFEVEQRSQKAPDAAGKS